MSTALDSRGMTGQGGFQRWVKLPTDDLPLIRPPKHHMLAHITGGLTKLYDLIKENKKEEPEAPASEEKTKEEASEESSGEDKNGPTDNGLNDNDGEAANGESNDDSQKSKQGEEEKSGDEEEKDNRNEKKDDEGGGEKSKEKPQDIQDIEDEEEETTPYTDEEGEFLPEKGMPYLAGRYRYVSILARGQSAIIIKVLDTFHSDKPLAIKVLHRVYKPIGSQEADILLELHRADPWLHVPFARLLNQFLYGPHYCLVLEYLSPTPLYHHYDQRDIREASSLPHIRNLTVKLLTVLGFLYKQNVIHADLKPENILLSKAEDLSSILVVDFGNALRNTDEELSLYYSDFELQTLLYRAPEVIFGMKFSLEVDMWSLGCLLAECYLGEPLFMGKSKKEILNKITALLGPFPKEFSDGEYSKEFADFIGRPMSRYQRLENLRKRLHNCKDSTFLMLVERLLTYLPDRRFTPFEAACHPFVACSTPFLYLTPSPGYIRYPTVLLDMSTYPYLPGLPDDEDENSVSALSRKRLASFARYKRPTPTPTPTSQAPVQKEKEKEKDKDKDKDKEVVVTSTVSNTVSGNPPLTTAVAGKKDGSDIQKSLGLPKSFGNMVPPESKTATRSDVKETLKSMGLRCEDFTISVYSREQAHAILRRQGVEVTPNNMPKVPNNMPIRGRGGYRNIRSGEMPRMPMPHNMRGIANANTWPANPRGARSQNVRKPVPRYEAAVADDDDDDDDCVILDPPDMPKPPPVAALPQQFQLMGTTVQVNRGAKRPGRPMMNQPQAKRQHARPMQYYHKEHEEYGAEASVQDTLKRLKNYNISITCRRNASGYGPRGPMDSESDMDDEGHMDSDEEEEDMTKYLECQIGEIDDMPQQEIYEDDDEIDCDDKDDMDYNPRGKKKRRSKSPRKGRRFINLIPHEDHPQLDSGMEVSCPNSNLEAEEGSKDNQNDSAEAEMEERETSSPIMEEPSFEEVESPSKTSEHSGTDEKDQEDPLRVEEEEDAAGKEDNAEDDDPLRTMEEGSNEDIGNSEGEKLDSEGEKLEEEDQERSDEKEKTEEGEGDQEEPELEGGVEEEAETNLEEAETMQGEEEVSVSENVSEKETKEVSDDNGDESSNKKMEGRQVQDGPEEEEIDDELEKVLLSGDVGEEGEVEEEL